MIRPALCILGALLAVGCVNSPVNPATGAGGAGTTSGVGAGGAGTTSGVGGGGGGTCGAVQLGEATFELAIDGSSVPPQPPVFPYETTVEGKVLSSAPGVVTIDACAPGSNCDAGPAKLEVKAPKLPSSLVPVGALVRLRLRVEETSNSLSVGVQSQVLIENLPNWGGSPNPISTTSRIWFAAFTSGSPVGSPPSFVPFTIEEIRCGACYPPGNKEELTITFPEAATIAGKNGEPSAFDITGERAGHYVFQGLSAQRDCEGNGVISYWLTGS